MNRIEEKLYLEIWLCCENKECVNDFETNSDAKDPMEIWARVNSVLAVSQGWTVSSNGRVLCPLCSKTSTYK